MPERKVRFSYGPLQRIVNVHWGGGKFVIGTLQGAESPPVVLYSDGGTDWDKLGPFSFGQFGQIWAGTYAQVNSKSVFLLGGDDGGDALGEGQQQGVLMMSENGRDWTEVHRMDAGESAIIAIVWDKNVQAFFAEGSAYVQSGTSLTQQNKLYRSETGQGWTEVDSKTHIYPIHPDDEMDGLIVPHCSGKATDYRGVPVPGGVYGESASVLIAPNNPAHVDYASGVVRNGGDGTVKITTPKDTKIVDTGVPLVSAVAYAGGAWIAVGGPGCKIARSEDNGATWEIVFDTSDGIAMAAVAK